MRKNRKTLRQELPQQPQLPVYSPDCNVGLSAMDVNMRISHGVVNTAVESPTKTEKQIIRDNCFTFFNLIFVVLAVLLVLVRSFSDMMFLMVAIINTVIGIVQEIRSKRTIDKLTLMTTRKVPTIRDGRQMMIPSDQLVRDDIVDFGAGDQICADAVVRIGRVTVNESLLTGEEDAIVKNVGDVLLSGSFIVSGRCRAQLTQVGAASYASRLTLEAKKDINAGNSEMMASLDKIIRFIGIAMVPLGGIMFFKQYKVLQLGIQASVQGTVASLVGMIPEGLYLLTSVALAVSMIRLAQKHVLTRDMNCIESLARVDVLCVDKTGTITESVMEPSEPIALDTNKTVHQLDQIISEIYHACPPDNDTGRAMAEKFCKESVWKAEKMIPFSSAAKWTGAVFRDEGAYILGAPEFIMAARYPEIAGTVSEWSARGYRVLLLAEYAGVPIPGRLDMDSVIPLAIIPLTNRIRPEAPATFRYFAEQGVAVRVISGDNPETVSEVAHQAGIVDADLFVDASTLQTDEELEEAAVRYVVFGRVTPDQKRKIIRAMQKAGHTVAMTGDGVNDVLALKDADCGIAMASGAEAASQAAQLVLLDSDFSKMPDVVDEGRRVINNIQRAASLFFVKNIFSLLISVISIFVDMPYPLVPLHLSVISGLTIGIPAFFLALEPNHERVKGRFITNVFLRALPGGITNVFLILLVEAFVAIFDFPTEQLYTMSAVVMSVIGLRVLYQVSRPLNWKRTVVIISMTVALLFCFTSLGFIFGYTMPTIETGLVLVVLTMLSFQVMRTVLQVFEKSEEMVHNWKEKQIESFPVQK